jgi:hypothetical protein
MEEMGTPASNSVPVLRRPMLSGASASSAAAMERPLRSGTVCVLREWTTPSSAHCPPNHRKAQNTTPVRASSSGPTLREESLFKAAA